MREQSGERGGDRGRHGKKFVEDRGLGRGEREAALSARGAHDDAAGLADAALQTVGEVQAGGGEQFGLDLGGGELRER